MSLARPFAGILFDLDGVLVDSMHVVRKLWREWAALRGLDPEAVSRASRGGPGIETLRILDPEMDAEAEARRLSALEHSYLHEITVMPGAHETLAAVTDVGVPWAIVTSGTLEVARGRIQHCGLLEPHALVVAEDVVRGKPHPEPYRRGAERLGVAVERCLVVEDSPGGIRAGTAAGATVVGLVGSHPPERLKGADLVIDHLASLRFTGAPEGARVNVPPAEV